MATVHRERDERFNQLNPKEEGRGLVPTPCQEKHGHAPKSSKTGEEIRWGDIGMGRTPQFIREDRGINISNFKTLEVAQNLDKDALGYKQKFQKALQFF